MHHPRSRLILSSAVGAMLAALAACGPEGDGSAGQPAASNAATMPGAVTLTIGNAPQQTFRAFGFSFTHDDPYLTLSPDQRMEANRLLFEELGTRVVRLWHEPGNPERTKSTYLDGGVVEGALASGVEDLLLAPEGYTPGDPEVYAETLANDIAALRLTYGVPITVSGTQNEPGSGQRATIPDADMAPLYRALRAKLDAKGLAAVRLLAPEYASNDQWPRHFLDVIQADPAAAAAFVGVAHHSYNMAADQELARRALAAGKEYWQTEAGGGAQDGSAELDYDFAATASARFLNDLNNGVTHWLWFIGLGQGNRDVLQKLVMLTDRGFMKNFAYHHLQQVSTRFPPGTVLRHITSDLADYPDLKYSYGVKPPLNAAAGVRPDGRYVIGIVNHTAGAGRDDGWGYHAAQTYQVTLSVPELAGREIAFDICRTGRQGALQCAGQLAMTDGRATLELASADLITLVSTAPVGAGS
jgi:hypothetical protein